MSPGSAGHPMAPGRYFHDAARDRSASKARSEMRDADQVSQQVTEHNPETCAYPSGQLP